MSCNRAMKLDALQCRYTGRTDWGRLQWGGTLADTPGDCPAASGRLQVSMTQVVRGLAAAPSRQSPWLFLDPSQGNTPASRATCLGCMALQG